MMDPRQKQAFRELRAVTDIAITAIEAFGQTLRRRRRGGKTLAEVLVHHPAGQTRPTGR